MDEQLSEMRNSLVKDISQVSLESVLDLFSYKTDIKHEYLDVDDKMKATILFNGRGKYLLTQTSLPEIHEHLKEVPDLLDKSKMYDLLAGDVDVLSERIAGLFFLKLRVRQIAERLNNARK